MIGRKVKSVGARHDEPFPIFDRGDLSRHRRVHGVLLLGCVFSAGDIPRASRVSISSLWGLAGLNIHSGLHRQRPVHLLRRTAVLVMDPLDVGLPELRLGNVSGDVGHGVCCECRLDISAGRGKLGKECSASFRRDRCIEVAASKLTIFHHHYCRYEFRACN